MKKILLLLLLIVGGVSTASATAYTVFFDQDSNWYKLCDLTDEDGDGTYSAIVNMETASKLGWGRCTIVLSSETSLGDNWANVIWANTGDSDKSILSETSFTLSSWANDGKLYIPITDATFDTYAIRLDYTEDTNTFSGTRMIEFASSNDDWHTTNPVYMPETAHNSGIFTGILELPKDTEYKFVSNNNGSAGWYGKDESSISTSGSNIKIEAHGVYTITADFNNNYVAPALVKETASVGTYGMATLCSEYALDFTGITAVTAYTITANDKATGGLTKSKVTGQVKAGTGLYIEGDANASADVPTTIYTTDPGTNMLVGVTSETDIAQIDGSKTNYILTVNTANGNVATPKFFKVNDKGNTVPAGKAYLQIPTEDAAREFFWFDSETTAVKAVKQEQKFDGKVFNLAGQRIANPTKGLYIVNGKKVSVK